MTEKQIRICGHGSGFPTIKNMEEYLTNRYNQIATNGKHKGIVAVRRLKGITDADRQEFIKAYNVILGRNYYSQSLREHVFTAWNGRYYSDCSSSGDACYAMAGHEVGWLNTAGIYNSGKFESVPVIIKNGHIQNPEVLKVADALLFAGNDPSRPLQIGHVEYVYEIRTESSWHWLEVDGTWYYQDSDGRNTYGWKQIQESGGGDDHWYFFNKKGQMQTGVQEVNGEIYYLQETGPLKGACCKTDDRGVQRVWNIPHKD